MDPSRTPLPQSVLETASDGARLIGDLTIALTAGAALVLLLVMVLLTRAARSAGSPVRPQRWLIGGGVAFPGVVLAVLLLQGLQIGDALSHNPEFQGMEVDVIAHRWWWEMRYRDPQGNTQVVVANELHLPADCAVVLNLFTRDVIHSFWVPSLAGKVDMIPGHRNQLAIHATKPGRFRGQCAEYCGTQHANMGLEVVVQSPNDFRAWLLNQAAPSVAANGAQLQRGKQVFLDSSCSTCHAIRGTGATGVLGPDLTHLASRRMLAAATVHNNPASLIAWILDAQHLKAGNLMPSMPAPERSEDLHALIAYLGSLH
jgi:cytochrome c oxidase subunit II